MVLVVETHGTFVYRVVSKTGLRTEPSVGEESRFGDNRFLDAAGIKHLVAVECIQPSRVGSNNGALAPSHCLDSIVSERLLTESYVVLELM